MSNAERAKRQQDYDPNPPRCFSCIYFRRAPLKQFVQRTVTSRSGKKRTVLVPLKKGRVNPVIETCTFGNFEVVGRGVCDEWRNRAGERLDRGAEAANG